MVKPFTEFKVTEADYSVGVIQRQFNCTLVEAHRYQEAYMTQRLFDNGEYQVTLSGPHPCRDPFWPPTHHLTIVRHDREPCHNWQDLQEIKNLIMGPEYEAMEIYPTESRLVDMGHQYHLWVFPEGFWVPTGYLIRQVRADKE